MDPITIVPLETYAKQLVEAHFFLEPGIQKIVRLEAPGLEGVMDEPLKLLEVNTNTLATGIRPVLLPARVEGTEWYPPVVIVEVTPQEFEQIRETPTSLPNNWQMKKTYERK